jgi:hypothetical protein
LGERAGLSDRIVGESGGSESVSLSLLEMASHKHNIVLGRNGDLKYPGDSFPTTRFATNVSVAVAMSMTVGLSGAGSPHNNMGPSIACLFLMATTVLITPVGSIVHAHSLIGSSPGEMSASGQVTDRIDLLSVLSASFNRRVPNGGDIFLMHHNPPSFPLGSVVGANTHQLSSRITIT